MNEYDEGQDRTTQVDSRAERRIAALGPPPSLLGGPSVVRALIVGGALLGIGAGYLMISAQMAEPPVADKDKIIPAKLPPPGSKQETEPKVPDNFVFSPQFETTDGPFEAGTAFVIKLKDQKRPVVLTAMSLFGSGGGLAKQFTAAELPAFIKRANFYNVFENAEQVCTSDTVLALPSGPDGVAAFLADEQAHVPAVELAENKPRVGDAVFVAARMSEGAPPGQRLHRALVTAVSGQNFTFKYDNQKLQTEGSGGAPVLNAAGQVAGVQVSFNDDDVLHGVAQTVERAGSLLRAALKELAYKQASIAEAEAKAQAKAGAGETAAPAENLPIGRTAALGLISIELENYWAEDAGDANDVCCTALTAWLGNAGDKAMTLPAIEVYLVDGEGRQYKAHRNKQPPKGAMNPLMRVKNIWAFQLAKEASIRQAVFKTKEAAAYFDLTQRTPENAALVASKNYLPALTEAVMFASPRMAARLEYEKAKAEHEDAAAEIELSEKDFKKIERAFAKSKDAVESAKAPLEKAKREGEAALDKLKYIKANWDSIPARARTQQESKAQQELDRAVRHAAEAAEAVKQKETAMGKLQKELKEAESRLKSERQKLDARWKSVQTLQQKL